MSQADPEARMSRCNELDMWTVYDHPTDYPNDFVARRHVLRTGVPNSKPMSEATSDAIISKDLEKIRGQLRGAGLMCVPRMQGDEPQIVEVWL